MSNSKKKPSGLHWFALILGFSWSGWILYSNPLSLSWMVSLLAGVVVFRSYSCSVIAGEYLFIFGIVVTLSAVLLDNYLRTKVYWKINKTKNQLLETRLDLELYQKKHGSYPLSSSSSALTNQNTTTFWDVLGSSNPDFKAKREYLFNKEFSDFVCVVSTLTEFQTRPKSCSGSEKFPSFGGFLYHPETGGFRLNIPRKSPEEKNTLLKVKHKTKLGLLIHLYKPADQEVPADW